MKKMVLLMTAFMMFHSAAHAAAPTYPERIQAAIDALNSFAEGAEVFQVTPADDEKAMLSQVAAKMELDAQDFEDNWVGDDTNKAWEVDSGNWGVETRQGAQDYIMGSLDQVLENPDLTDEQKIRYVDSKLKVEKAFTVLSYIKSIKYGVSAYGAVQCGVTFPSLMILDTKTGKAYQIIMEGSGC
jgi:hypothetical protein